MNNLDSKDLTICIPTYNRPLITCSLISSLPYRSNVEFILVDDGSDKEVITKIEDYVNQNNYPIKILTKQNGGKLSAIRLGLQYSTGLFFTDLDSDDMLSEENLDNILTANKEVLRRNEAGDNLIGSCGHCENQNSGIVGSKFPKESYIDNYFNLRFKHKVTGDKEESILSEVLRQVDVSKFEHEKVSSNGIHWALLGNKNWLYLDKIFSQKNHQQAKNNITDNRIFHIIKPKNSTRAYFKILLLGELEAKYKKIFRWLIQYVRFTLHGARPIIEKEIFYPFCLRLALIFPAAYVLFLYDHLRLSRNEG